MAVHGFTRATEDIDLLVRPDDLERIYAAVAGLGYLVHAKPMNFKGGDMQIRRVSKIDPTDGDLLTLDLLLVTPASAEVWETREVRTLSGEPVPVVSREGLVTLKKSRGSEQDVVDIKRLLSDE